MDLKHPKTNGFTPEQLDTLIEAGQGQTEPARKLLFHEIVKGTRAERDAMVAANRDALAVIHARAGEGLKEAGLSFADLIAYDFQS